MLINHTFGIILIILLGVGVIALFAWLWKKMKKKPVAGGTIGFFISCIICIGFWVTAGRVYVVNAPNDYSKYLLFGSSSYTLENGSEVKCVNGDEGALLINNSQENIILQQVIYGYGGPSHDKRLEAQDYMNVGKIEVHYFFDEEIPESIEVEGSGYVVRLWVVMEDDYGFILQEDLDNIRDLLEEHMDED